MENVGRFEPGASYVYEKSNGITYARKIGDPPDTRFEIGRDLEVGRVFGRPMSEVAVMVDIMNAAEHNPTLQDALDRVKVLYELSKQPETVAHHPV